MGAVAEREVTASQDRGALAKMVMTLLDHWKLSTEDQAALLGIASSNRYRDFKYQETLYELFAKQFEMAKLDEAREGATIQVVDAAQPPELKSKPKKALIAILATLATGFALLLFVFVRQALRNGAQDIETAQKLASIKSSWRKALGKA